MSLRKLVLEKDSWGWVQEDCFFGSLRWDFANVHQRAPVTESEVQGSWVRHLVVHYGGQAIVIEVQGSCGLEGGLGRVQGPFEGDQGVPWVIEGVRRWVP